MKHPVRSGAGCQTESDASAEMWGIRTCDIPLNPACLKKERTDGRRMKTKQQSSNRNTPSVLETQRCATSKYRDKKNYWKRPHFQNILRYHHNFFPRVVTWSRYVNRAFSERNLRKRISISIHFVSIQNVSSWKEGKLCKLKETHGGLTLLEAEVGDFVDGRALAIHEGEELVQEQLLFRVREPAALTADLHAAHHVLLEEGEHPSWGSEEEVD